MINFFINKKIFLIFLIFFTLVGIFFLLLIKKPNLANNKPIPKTENYPTITPIQIQKQPSPSIFIPSKVAPTFTGVYEEEIPQEKINLSEKINSLQKKLPITTESFELKYDYRNDQFIVVLKPAFEENKEKFLQWLKENNYSEIPNEYFNFR